MNIISKILYNKRQSNTCALIPFITAGYPNIEITTEALYELNCKGADIIELGIPYSDALADGPMIQNSSKVALEKGVYVDQVLDLLSKVTYKLAAPIVVFSYYNPILARGLDRFIMEIAFAGAKGLIIPDLPLEETDYLVALCKFYSIELILFISPSTSYDRISLIVSKSPGSLYFVSTNGVTGMRDNLNMSVNTLCQYIKSKTDKSIMLGFGISTVEQVYQISKWDIDGIVMGSAFINILSNTKIRHLEVIEKLGSFCNSIKLSINHQ
uniref:Tryptophan synthase alpha chain n=1 Tax=Dipterocladia arabiensis TaxID=2007176 RepID=A0A1Z1M051_9FLOR|nr:Tryptophan synthase alpha subunit [Dipterocladia arabiensis]ARW59328.1 Tryptophan synthase alpha subunit [Dipterocladia arabiensis]